MLAPLAVVVVLGADAAGLARPLAGSAARRRRSAAPWLCGYAREAEVQPLHGPPLLRRDAAATSAGWAARRGPTGSGSAAADHEPESTSTSPAPAPRTTHPADGGAAASLRPRHPAGRPARRRPALRLRRTRGGEAGLPPPLPRPGRPLRHQHRRRRPAVLRQLPGRPRLRLRPRSPAVQRPRRVCRPMHRRWTASPTWCPAANWAEREIRDLVGIEPVGHPYPKRLVLPDGWPDGVHPLRKDVPWNQVPEGFDPERRVPVRRAPPEAARWCPSGRSTPPSTSRPTSGSTSRARWCAAASTAASWSTAASRSWPSRCSPTTTSR